MNQVYDKFILYHAAEELALLVYENVKLPQNSIEYYNYVKNFIEESSNKALKNLFNQIDNYELAKNAFNKIISILIKSDQKVKTR